MLPSAAPPIDLMERRAVQRINAVRGEHMRPPLRTDADLARLAREYSCALLSPRRSLARIPTARPSPIAFSRQRGKSFAPSGRTSPHSTGPGDPLGAAIDAWMRSPGHRENILRPDFTDTGVGVCRDGTRTTSPRCSCDRTARGEPA